MKLARRTFLNMLVVAAVGLTAVSGGPIGCAATALTWVSLGLSLIATISPTIPGIISAFASLLGKTLTAAQLAKIQSIFTHIADVLTQIQTAIRAYETNPVGTILQEIKTLLTTLQSSLNITSLLNDIGITDPATVTRFTGIINVILGLVSDILGVLPSVTVLADGTVHVSSKLVTKQLAAAMSPSAFAARFNAELSIQTGNVDVDAAFAKVRATEVTVKT